MSFSTTKLSSDDIVQSLASLSGWSLSEGKLHREYHFGNFAEAFDFMSAAAIVVEELNHHPEWSNCYDKVVIDLVSHDAGGVTKLDLKLAERFDALAKKMA